jgi:hypothetical protein
MSLEGRVHQQVMLSFVARGHAPSLDAIAEALGASRGDVAAALRSLHEGHGLVLQPGESTVWVAHPFSASPTGIWVAGPERGWWAPCIWCAMGIVAIAAPDAVIHARFGGENREARVVVQRGALVSEDWPVHFAIPARDAWLNVIHFCSTVLPFERVADVAAWCDRHALPRGDVLALTQVLALAREWYGPYLDSHWRKRTLDEAQAVFERLGLRGDHWRLPTGRAGPY